MKRKKERVQRRKERKETKPEEKTKTTRGNEQKREIIF